MKHFSFEKNRIYELFINKKLVSKKRIDETMSQNYLYEHPKLETNYIEDGFAKFESIIFPIIDELIEKMESNYENGKSITEYVETIKRIIPFALLFYFRSGALLKEYSMDANEPKIIRVERMLQNILNLEYILGLTGTIWNAYECGIIVDEKERFLLSDQYVSTVALKFKNRFSNASNRQIGMIETMILIPLSSRFYIAFFSGNKPDYIKKDQFSVLNDEEVENINDVIYQNSYVKCVGKYEDELHRVKDISVESTDPTKCIMQYSDGTIQDRILKREVFMYDADKDMNQHYVEYMVTYTQKIRGKVGRNDKCICGSGKKYKKCCMAKYEAAAHVMQGIKNPKSVDYTLKGAVFTEESVLEYKGPEGEITNEKDKPILNEIKKIMNEDLKKR